jgi:hypothetical protein
LSIKKIIPDYPLVKDCTLNVTPDCTLVKADNSVDYAGKKKQQTTIFLPFIEKVHNGLNRFIRFFL